MSEAPLPFAAVASDGFTDVDGLLAGVVAAQRAAGRRVHGLLMRHDGPPAGGTACAEHMWLVDVATGAEYLVSQPMGRHSKACRADPQGFARATEVLRRALAEAPELVVINRFGRLEAEGGGLSAELLALMAEGVPLLTAVAPAYREAWLHFSGGAPLLPPEPAAVQAWVAQVLPTTHLA
jgi:hypothetical protein